MTNDPARDNLLQQIRDLKAQKKALEDEKAHLESVMSAEATLRMELRGELEFARENVKYREDNVVKYERVIRRVMGPDYWPGFEAINTFLDKLRARADERDYFHERLSQIMDVVRGEHTAAQLLDKVEEHVGNSAFERGAASAHGLVQLQDLITGIIGTSSYPGDTEAAHRLNTLRDRADEGTYFYEQLPPLLLVPRHKHTAVELMRLLQEKLAAKSTVSNSINGNPQTAVQAGDIPGGVRF